MTPLEIVLGVAAVVATVTAVERHHQLRRARRLAAEAYMGWRRQAGMVRELIERDRS